MIWLPKLLLLLEDYIFIIGCHILPAKFCIFEDCNICWFYIWIPINNKILNILLIFYYSLLIKIEIVNCIDAYIFPSWYKIIFETNNP